MHSRNILRQKQDMLMTDRINRRDVIEFFNRCAPGWDDEMIRNEDIISSILDNAGVGAGMKVLDVACGTGVLFGDYLNRGAASVTGVDISPEMAKRAAAKFSDPRINVICGDICDVISDPSGSSSAMETPSGPHRVIENTSAVTSTDQYDIVMVYNAFPHFPEPEKLIRTLSQAVKPGGRLSIAHGMSREKIDSHHSGSACHVSRRLMSADELRRIMLPYFDVDVVISDSSMYQVAGTRK